MNKLLNPEIIPRIVEIFQAMGWKDIPLGWEPAPTEKQIAETIDSLIASFRWWEKGCMETARIGVYRYGRQSFWAYLSP